MPDEPITYRVNLDTADLEAQLEAVKQRIDIATGGVLDTEGGTSFMPAPSMSASPMGMAELGGIGYLPPMNEGPSSLTDFISQGWENVERLGQVGYHKLLNETELAQTAGPGYLLPPVQNIQSMPSSGAFSFSQMQSNAYDMGVLDKFAQGSIFSNNWDPRSPMSRAEHDRMLMESAPIGGMSNIVAEGAALGLGLIAGSAAGVATTALTKNPVLGFAVGTAVDIGVTTLAKKPLEWALGPSSEERMDIQRGFYFSQISEAGRRAGVTSREGRILSSQLRDFTDSVEGRYQKFSHAEIDEIITNFDQSGGFADVRTSQEYKEKVKNLIETHREVMHTLRMSTEEASVFLGEMNRSGMIDTGSSVQQASTLQKMQQFTKDYGYTPLETTELMGRGGEIVRGTGISMRSGGMSMLDAVSMAQASQLTGNYSNEYIRQMGGAEQVAAMMVQSGYNFAQSSTGQVAMLAGIAQGGLSEGAMLSPQDMLSAASSQINSNRDLMEWWGGRRELASEYGADIMNRTRALMLARQAYHVQGTGDPITRQGFLGYAEASGLSYDEAEMLAGYAFQSVDEVSQLFGRKKGYSVGNLDQVSKLGYGTAKIGQFFSALGEGAETLVKYPFRVVGDQFEEPGRIVYGWGQELAEDFSRWNTGEYKFKPGISIQNMEARQGKSALLRAASALDFDNVVSEEQTAKNVFAFTQTAHWSLNQREGWKNFWTGPIGDLTYDEMADIVEGYTVGQVKQIGKEVTRGRIFVDEEKPLERYADRYRVLKKADEVELSETKEIKKLRERAEDLQFKVTGKNAFQMLQSAENQLMELGDFTREEARSLAGWEMQKGTDKRYGGHDAIAALNKMPALPIWTKDLGTLSDLEDDYEKAREDVRIGIEWGRESKTYWDWGKLGRSGVFDLAKEKLGFESKEKFVEYLASFGKNNIARREALTEQANKADLNPRQMEVLFAALSSENVEALEDLNNLSLRRSIFTAFKGDQTIQRSQYKALAKKVREDEVFLDKDSGELTESGARLTKDLNILASQATSVDDYAETMASMFVDIGTGQYTDEEYAAVRKHMANTVGTDVMMEVFGNKSLGEIREEYKNKPEEFEKFVKSAIGMTIRQPGVFGESIAVGEHQTKAYRTRNLSAAVTLQKELDLLTVDQLDLNKDGKTDENLLEEISSYDKEDKEAMLLIRMTELVVEMRKANESRGIYA